MLQFVNIGLKWNLKILLLLMRYVYLVADVGGVYVRDRKAGER